MPDNRVEEKYKRYLLLEKGLSKNTIEAYMTDLQKFSTYVAQHNLSYRDISYIHLRDFLSSLHDQNISPRSVARILSGVKSFFKFMLLDQYIDHDPSELLDAPKIGYKLPQVLSVEEIDRILSVIDVSTVEGSRNYAIIETLYSCGLRISELTSLKFSNLYFDEGFIRVEGKGSKQRLVPISETAIQKIKNYLQHRQLINIRRGSEDVLFVSTHGRSAGSMLSRSMIFQFIKEYAELAGIKKEISPHTFRHSFATHLLERGANIRVIQEMLGHEKITTTEIYTHIDRNFLRQEIIEHHPRNRK
ncbi:MAG: integrase/recombinase XerD [Bacteroidota bacterium]|nr:xerD [Methermicoccus sp.]MDN5305852.1 integrase/recombinase XerD [Bacteroidota bacterium]